MIDYGQFTMGRVVRQIRPLSEVSDKPFTPGRLGHVIGFSTSEWESGHAVILRVRWCDGIEQDIHPANVVPL